MAIGKVNYKMGQNLEPIANAVTSMNQSSTKKDKPTEMAQKIKAISTDATATEGNVLNGQTFYSGGSKKTGSMPNKGAWTGRIGVNGKITIPAGYHNGSGYVDQSITSRGSITPAVSVTGTNPMYVRMNQGAYFTNASSGYPETSVTLTQLRGAGMALQSELTAMTNDRNNWKNTANSKVDLQRGTHSSSSPVVLSWNITQVPKLILCYITDSSGKRMYVPGYIILKGHSNCVNIIYRDTSSGNEYSDTNIYSGSHLQSSLWHHSSLGSTSFDLSVSGTTATLKLAGTSSSGYTNNYIVIPSI